MLRFIIDKEVSAEEIRELVQLIHLIRSAKTDPQYTQPVPHSLTRLLLWFCYIFALIKNVFAATAWNIQYLMRNCPV